MNWQDYIVWAIGLVIAALLLHRSICLFQGKRRHGCSACSKECPLRELRRGKRL